MEYLKGVDPVARPPWRISDEGSADCDLGLRALVAECFKSEDKLPDAETSYSVLLQTTSYGDPTMPLRWHASRVAHLMKHGWGDAIAVECTDRGLFIEDGNHRLAAAMLLKREHIFVDIAGPIHALERFNIPEADLVEEADQVQISSDGQTVWVHAMDGSTVGRFDWRFGIDVHTTVTAQLAGQSQCLHCTHTAPTENDWQMFRQLTWQHHGVFIPDRSEQQLGQIETGIEEQIDEQAAEMAHR